MKSDDLRGALNELAKFTAACVEVRKTHPIKREPESARVKFARFNAALEAADKLLDTKQYTNKYHYIGLALTYLANNLESKDLQNFRETERVLRYTAHTLSEFGETLRSLQEAYPKPFYEMHIQDIDKFPSRITENDYLGIDFSEIDEKLTVADHLAHELDSLETSLAKAILCCVS